MNGYICVYRRSVPKDCEFRLTEASADSDCNLRKFLGEYLLPDRYYDWGDDPAFFAAKEFLGDVRRASWGVCRRDVRRRLIAGDLIVFFCAKQHPTKRQRWDYYYIGFGTVEHLICRRQLWTNEQFVDYRDFYNVLARVEGLFFIQKETFHPYHGDWEKRLQSPYIIFSDDPRLTHFNLVNPLHVATYMGNAIPEQWLSSRLGRSLESVLFEERGIQRRLRSSPTGYGHTFVNLRTSKGTTRPGRKMEGLRVALLKISREI